MVAVADFEVTQNETPTPEKERNCSCNPEMQAFIRLFGLIRVVGRAEKKPHNTDRSRLRPLRLGKQVGSFCEGATTGLETIGFYPLFS